MSGDLTIAIGDGRRIPALGFGTGGSMTEACGEIVLSALRAGYRHIDTARKYGSERGVGEAIRASGLARGEVFVTTKVSHEDLAPDALLRSAEASLAALGLDFVDLLLVHWPLPGMPFRDTIGALAQARRRGLARSIGVANFNIALLSEAMQVSPEPLAALQAEYHPFLDQTKLLEFCRRNGLAFVSYCPLARGRILADETLAGIAAARGRTVPQVVLRWLLQQQGVAAIPGSSNPERIRENFDVFGFSLDDEEMRRIHALARPDGRIVKPKDRSPVWDAA
ncbi:aldo/keto reductase [Propylenella binzhouense]|uniref:Aldo/keto reductase n=1 Tax=Propylenella binzhouense TaxID=2555902 RepID=A0A964WUX2_9HYPH|nr:aldo/keto reductase [Propylenella binzhouense]MYZ49474.1 aldo/keto reductase [Propylenella binzhouense]